MTEDILDLAAHSARAQSEPGWIDISAAIQQRLRSVTRRSRPIRAAADNGAPLFITDHVLNSRLRAAIADLRHCELDRVRLIGDHDTCTGAVVEVVVADSGYGQDLTELAGQIRTTTYRVLTELLGPTEPPFGADGVDITITDLTTDTSRH
jgi:hypothetical protein